MRSPCFNQKNNNIDKVAKVADTFRDVCCNMHGVGNYIYILELYGWNFTHNACIGGDDYLVN